MYTDKRNVLQTVALLKEHNISKIVLCPDGSSSPIVGALADHPFFTCYHATDERSAGFFALGLALHGGKPAVVCCTSGAALPNIHPAVAEAHRQHVPLVVISADASQVSFGGLVGRTVNLTAVHTDEDERRCNLLVNEALMELNHHGRGPVHINIEISEPPSQHTTESLPSVRVITRYQGLNVYDREYDTLIERLNKYNRRMIVVGQMSLIYLFGKNISKLLYKHFVWLTEHAGNRTIPGIPIKNFDTALRVLPEKTLLRMVPELVITYGGQIVSERLKKFLRENPPKEHWHVSAEGEAVDMFGTLTTVIEMDPFEFLEKIAYLLENKPTEFPRLWESNTKELPCPEFDYSGMAAVGGLMQSLPVPSALHLGNAHIAHCAQLYHLPEGVEVCGNCGADSHGGSLSTAMGYAVASDKLNFVVIGTANLLYDMNALWSICYGCNLRILLLNNSRQPSAESIATERGFLYQGVRSMEELDEAVRILTDPNPVSRPILTEVFTDKDEDTRLMEDYYQQLKK